MSNRIKVKPDRSLTRRIQTAYGRYAGKLSVEAGGSKAVVTARVVCEGSIEVGIGLMEEAQEMGDDALSQTLLVSLRAARDRLNQYEAIQ